MTTQNHSLESYFAPFREGITGINQRFTTPFGEKPLIYADWTASGRYFSPIEQRVFEEIGPFIGNTHTETSVTGCSMTMAYHEALETIKRHVNAGPEDVIVKGGSGMTGVVNKFQRMLGFKIHERYRNMVQIPDEERPVVFVTHMEHHSNHTSWLETMADVVCVDPDPDGRVNLYRFEQRVKAYRNRPVLIASVTACSNVTGIETPYHEIAKCIHKYGGLCFVDFACSAPYVNIDMHPEDEAAKLDAIFFSPHKFLGGPGSPGILVFDRNLYQLKTPDHPGGGTVDWTDPWGGHKFIDDIEAREDGGTPPFLQTIRAALAIKLKEEMGVENILKREHEQLGLLWKELDSIPGLHILANHIRERLGVISFYIEGLHFNLGTQLLNDRYGIQVRGGCSCAGTYGHYLLQVSYEQSKQMTAAISAGNLAVKLGWIRMSIHPTMTDAELLYLTNAIWEVSRNHQEWGKDYEYNACSNEFTHKQAVQTTEERAHNWIHKPFSISSDIVSNPPIAAQKVVETAPMEPAESV